MRSLDRFDASLDCSAASRAFSSSAERASSLASSTESRSIKLTTWWASSSLSIRFHCKGRNDFAGQVIHGKARQIRTGCSQDFHQLTCRHLIRAHILQHAHSDTEHICIHGTLSGGGSGKYARTGAAVQSDKYLTSAAGIFATPRNRILGRLESY